MTLSIAIQDVTDTDNATDLARRVYHFTGKITARAGRRTRAADVFVDYSRAHGVQKVYLGACMTELDAATTEALRGILDVDYFRGFADNLETLHDWRTRPALTATF